MANPKVTTEFDGKDNVTPVAQKITMSLRDMGEKVSMIGMRMSAAITLPITLAAKGLISFGSDSSKTLSDLNKAIGDANASQDPAKIKAAWAAWNGLSPAVREAGVAYDRLQEALKPVNDSFNQTKATLLTALVPILKELTPTLISVANGIGDVAKGFAALPDWAKNTIIELVGFAFVLGPTITLLGEFMKIWGTFQLLGPKIIELMGGLGKGGFAMGTGFKSAAVEFAALTAAFLLWKQIFDDPTFKKIWAMGMAGGAKMLGASDQYANQVFMQQATQSGLIQPTGPAGAGSGNTYNYNNYGISTATRDEVTRLLASLQPGVARATGHQ